MPIPSQPLQTVRAIRHFSLSQQESQGLSSHRSLISILERSVFSLSFMFYSISFITSLHLLSSPDLSHSRFSLFLFLRLLFFPLFFPASSIYIFNLLIIRTQTASRSVAWAATTRLLGGYGPAARLHQFRS